MAINRQDYQYIRNTIPGQQNQISDGSLGVGSKVTNLLLELKEENIFNPNYADYYGSIDENNNSKKWATNNDTTQKGYLSINVELEKNTTYVLQIIGATTPHNTTLPQNALRINNRPLSFDQYIFFDSGNGPWKIEIYGLSFGYKIIGLNSEGTEIQLRTFISPVQAKVFLFKTDTPWMVDKNGVIVGIKDTTLRTLLAGEDAMATTYSLEEAKELFKSSPRIVIKDSNKIRIALPEVNIVGGNIQSSSWKHFSNWSLLNEDQDKIRLIVCRDYLLDSTRDYCKDDEKHQKKMQRGILRTIQKTTKNPNDTSNNIQWNTFPEPINEKNKKIAIQFNPSLLNLSNTSVSIDFPWKTEEQFIQENEICNYSLNLFSLLGYNYDHCNSIKSYQNEFIYDSGLAYQYTSICFAWGLVTKNSKDEETIDIISNYSVPVIIDRQLISVSWDADKQKYKIVPQDCEIKYINNGDYDAQAHYYITKKDPS